MEFGYSLKKGHEKGLVEGHEHDKGTMAYLRHLNDPWGAGPASVPLMFKQKTILAHRKMGISYRIPATGMMIAFRPTNIKGTDDWISNGFGRAANGDYTVDLGSFTKIDAEKLGDAEHTGTRLVAAGIKIDFVGREDEREGYWMSYTGHQTLQGENWFSQDVPRNETEFLQAGAEGRRIGETIKEVYYPFDNDDMKFTTEMAQFTQNYMCVILITGLSGARSFRIECVETVEYIPHPEFLWKVAAINDTHKVVKETVTVGGIRYNPEINSTPGGFNLTGRGGFRGMYDDAKTVWGYTPAGAAWDLIKK